MDRTSVDRSSRDVLYGMMLIAIFILNFNIYPADAGVSPYPQSPIISGINWDTTTLVTTAQGSDNFPITWGADGHLYTAWGDGMGFDGASDAGLGIARLEGSPANFQAIELWEVARGSLGGKAYGIISVNDVLYMFVGPNSGAKGLERTWLQWSYDRGITWQTSADFFTHLDGFSMPSFVQFGQDYAGVPSNLGSYIYFHSLDASAGTASPFTEINMGRVSVSEITNRASYEFFSGMSGSTPLWSSNTADRKPVLTDAGHGIFLPSVSYIPALNRYLLVTTHATGNPGGWPGSIMNTGGLGIFDAPEPWGPWTTVEYTDNWMGSSKFFFANIPTKQPDWLSADGKTFYIVYTGFGSVIKDAYQQMKGTFNLTVGTDTTAPTTPLGILPTPVDHATINVNWQASADPETGVSYYRIFRDGVYIGQSNTTSYIDSNLTIGTTYSYELSSVNGASLESGRSLAVTASTLNDTTAPTISSVFASGDPNKVTIIFSEVIDQVSATDVTNYGIDNGIAVLSASLGADLKTITLTTFPHVEGITYGVIVDNIMDRSNPANTIFSGSSETYSFVDQVVISNLAISSGLTYEVVQNGLSAGGLAYIDRVYSFSSVPALLENQTFIKTANDDKADTSASFMTFNVNKSVTVFVGLDDRIATPPSWLASFSPSTDKLVTTDTTLSLYSKDFSAGNIVLGGNESAKSMYSVVIIPNSTVVDTIAPATPTDLNVLGN